MSEPPSGTRLNYAKRLFTDKDLEALPLRKVIYPYEEVDFSQNGLSAEGLQKVLDLCLRCEKLRILKLFRNDIDDVGAEALAGFIAKCRTIEEMHLSHNHFTAEGVKAIVAAVDEHRPSSMNPLWLRLEQNDVFNPEEVVRDLKSRHSVCPRKDRAKCTVRQCVSGCKVHLPHFIFQRGGPQEGEGEEDGHRRRRKRRRWEEDETEAWGRNHVHSSWWDKSWEDKGGEDEPTAKRPRTKVAGGIFLRAVAAAVKGGGEQESAEGAPATKQKMRVVPANVASRTLSRLGVLSNRKKKVELKEGPAAGGARNDRGDKGEGAAKEQDEDGGEEAESSAAEGAAEEGTEEEQGVGEAESDADTGGAAASGAEGGGRQPAGDGAASASASPAHGSGRAAKLAAGVAQRQEPSDRHGSDRDRRRSPPRRRASPEPGGTRAGDRTAAVPALGAACAAAGAAAAPGRRAGAAVAVASKTAAIPARGGVNVVMAAGRRLTAAGTPQHGNRPESARGSP
uniref:Uncharacterized protein n=1 Tax=Alexandrium monilatum TaxID=311494 RepID=A0A7S4QWZ8_9DINO